MKINNMDEDGKLFHNTDGTHVCNNGSEEFSSWKIWKKRRYVVAILSFFGFFTVYILRVNLSVAIVAMTENKSVTLENGTNIYVTEFDWDSKMQGYVLSSFFYGYITTQLLGGWLSAKIGGKKVFGIGIGVTALLTLITPFAAKQNFYLLLAIRIIEGLFEGLTYPCVNALLVRWAPPLERSRLATISYSGCHAGTVFSMTVSGYLAKSFGWESIFYVFGLIAIAWLVLWWWIVAESPSEDYRITQAELRYIENSLDTPTHGRRIKHPWKKILTSRVFWAIVVAHFAENWGFFTLITQLPKFMKDVLHFEIGVGGAMSALPYLAMIISMQFSGYFSDWLQLKRILTTTQVRKLFSCGGFAAQTVFLLGAAFLLSPTGSTICFIIAVGMGGFAVTGILVNYLDIAPQHASVLTGIGNSFAAIPGIISPIIAGYIVTTPNESEWQIVFYITCGIYLMGTIIYGAFASGELQSWAKNQENDSNRKMLTSNPLKVIA